MALVFIDYTLEALGQHRDGSRIEWPAYCPMNPIPPVCLLRCYQGVAKPREPCGYWLQHGSLVFCYWKPHWQLRSWTCCWTGSVPRLLKGVLWITGCWHTGIASLTKRIHPMSKLAIELGVCVFPPAPWKGPKLAPTKLPSCVHFFSGQVHQVRWKSPRPLSTLKADKYRKSRNAKF